MGHYLQRELARVLEWDVARVRVVQPAVGGAFGGKSEPFDLDANTFEHASTRTDVRSLTVEGIAA